VHLRAAFGVLLFHTPIEKEFNRMGTGTSLFLLALGAILYFAVSASVSGISLATVGLILMIVGAIGLLVSLLMGSAWGDRRRDREVVVDRGRVR